ncbi:GrpB family protein [Paenibacillus antri]|uniref:GrpB family protein n=1 Tax=Paenibacillus antri TaxID=2582848 RepID=UPI001EE46E90|nr:GrpB family protein [Paenibacillus antri]
MKDPIEIVPYSPDWPERFRTIGSQVRRALDAAAIRIDHIGSTAVPGLDAKPIIDIQVSVASLEPIDAYRQRMIGIGYSWRSDNPDRTKRYFRESPEMDRTHIHMRVRGSWSEQFALLFRDYLRNCPEEAGAYAAMKREQAQRFRLDRESYVEAKEPMIWDIMRRASRWSQATGWAPGESDI